jgi:hypothetical protein
MAAQQMVLIQVVAHVRHVDHLKEVGKAGLVSVAPGEPRAGEAVVLPEVLLLALLLVLLLVLVGHAVLASYVSLWHEQHRHHGMDSLVLDSESVGLG